MVGRLILRTALPALLAVTLFVIAIFLILIPSFERSMLERKREMIRELTTSAWNILANFEHEVKAGRLSREDAQRQAIEQVRNLHYGPHLKDYFWINDMQPRMVVHPYRHDLDGQDLTGFTDPTGKRLFVEFVDVVRKQGAGYVEYQWQWRDDPRHIVPKLSYVKGFESWGWIIGTGIYMDDVAAEIRAVTHRLVNVSLAILIVVSLLLAYLALGGYRAERHRQAAEAALRHSEERYRILVESAGESILMALGDDSLFANASALRLLGYSQDELTRLRLDDVIVTPGQTDSPGKRPETPRPHEQEAPPRREAQLRRRDGTLLPAMLTFSTITLADRTGLVVVATDITQRKLAEEALGRSEAELRAQVTELRRLEARHETTINELQTALLFLNRPVSDDSPIHLLEEIRRAPTPEVVIALNRNLPVLAKVMIDNGAQARMVNRFITTNADALLGRLAEFAVGRLGPPPAPFVFMILGSEGRHEQTLCTDQDNAIVYQDVPPGESERTRNYFRQFGTLVCDWLHAAGYTYCKGEMMARNPQWCQPLTTWKQHAAGWINTFEAEDLLHTKIFFDFRAGWGDAGILTELRATIDAAITSQPRFLSQLARNVLLFAPPVGVFGNLLVETTPDHRKVLDIKSAMTPIVDFARLYALRHRIVATNTVERLTEIGHAGVLLPENCEEIVQVYNALMQIRVNHQARALAAGRPPDNLIEPDSLTYLDRKVLKESFSQIKAFQTRLSYDFTGTAGGLP